VFSDSRHWGRLGKSRIDAEYAIRMVDEADRRTLQPDALESAFEGRPLEAVAGGLVLSIVSFAIVLYAAYHGWYTHDLPRDWAYAGVGYGFLFYAMGVFIFAYGWERGDTMRTLRLGGFICATTFVTIVVLILLMKLRADAASEAAGVAGAGTTDR
jgi:hypothetical protein